MAAAAARGARQVQCGEGLFYRAPFAEDGTEYPAFASSFLRVLRPALEARASRLRAAAHREGPGPRLSARSARAH